MTVHCSCHGSLALLATGSFGSYRASPAPNRLPTFIASDMPARAACHLHSLGSRRTLLVLSYLPSLIAGVVAASRCLSPAHLAHTAPNMLVPHLACAELPSNLYCSCHVSLTLFATCLFDSCRAAPAAVLSHLLSFIANGAMPAMHCLPLQLHMLRVSSQLHAVLATCSFGSYSALPALSHLLTSVVSAVAATRCLPPAHLRLGIAAGLCCAVLYA